MEHLSDRINRLTESQTIAMSRMSRELKAQGHDIISLSLGEPDFNTPDFIKDAAKTAIDGNFTKYPPVPGYESLRQAICTKLKRDNNLDFTPDQVIVSTGAKQTLANVMLSLINPGDEVILPAPYWVSYFEMIRMAEGVPVVLETDTASGFKVSPEQLAAAITQKTRAMLFSSPCNPSGAAYTRDELAALAAVLEQHENIIAISDEIYEHIRYEGSHTSLAEFESISSRVVTVNGVSKAFSMTGWRIGYAAAPKWIVQACTKMQGQFTSGASTISQKAAEAALLADPAVVAPMKEKFKARRDMMRALLLEIEGFVVTEPEGAFYLFPDVSAYFGKSHAEGTINNASDLAMYLLTKAHVAAVTGEAFGSPNCLRLSYATSDDLLREAVSRIKNALNQLN